MMFHNKKDKYDAIIIGAGISGLICGCYLAKAGLKVLIAEQHHKPGGYCTSFKRKNYTFDAAAHSFGGYRKDGIMRRVFTDLEIAERLRIRRFDPSDIVITPHYQVSFWADFEKTIKGFQMSFPDESNNIKQFFYFLINPDPKSFVRIRTWTFKDILDKYFLNDKLKAILSFPLLGNGALPPSLMSAFIGAKIFREFLIDGGYYPENNMQAIPDALTQRFKELGGTLLLSSIVRKIKVKDNKVVGISLEKNGFIPSTYVVSNCDARQTFLKLLGGKIVGKDFLDRISNMTPSLSIFVLYLGINKYLANLPEPGTNVWFLSRYDLDKVYNLAKNCDFNTISRYMIRVSPDQKTILAFLNAPFKNKRYWDINKTKLLDSFINKIEKEAIPGLSKHIAYKDAATPYTLYRYTLNYKGASYGWACVPSQFGDPDFKKPSFLQNLYLTGHWSTQGLGIPGVTYLGYDTAKAIVRKLKQDQRR